jgi:membrane-associated phospholipid phosphatase
MEGLYSWGLQVIQALQQTPSLPLLYFFRAVTFLGEEPFYLLLLPLVYWCVDYRLGARLTIIFLLAVWLNVVLKDLLAQPRPFDLLPEVKLAEAEGYGLPSGHAQLGVVVWGLIAWGRGQRAGWWAAAVVVLLIGLSRVYLGVHFPTDVLGGWLVGGAILGLYLGTRQRLEGAILNLSLRGQLLLALAVPAALLVGYVTKETATPLPTLAGGALGLALLRHRAAFSTGGPLRQRALRYLAGLVVFAAVYVGLKVILPDEGEAGYLLGRAVRYGLVGLWISLGAPWVFLKLGLADRETQRTALTG